MTKLRKILSKEKVSQAELSRFTGISTNQINNYVTGRCDIPLKKAKKIADILEVKIDDLI